MFHRVENNNNVDAEEKQQEINLDTSSNESQILVERYKMISSIDYD